MKMQFETCRNNCMHACILTTFLSYCSTFNYWILEKRVEIFNQAWKAEYSCWVLNVLMPSFKALSSISLNPCNQQAKPGMMWAPPPNLFCERYFWQMGQFWFRTCFSIFKLFQILGVFLNMLIPPLATQLFYVHCLHNSVPKFSIWMYENSF